MMQDPILVFGAPRSGTTYLNAILNKQPGVRITHETRIFAWFHTALQASVGRPQLLLTHADAFREHLEPALANMVRNFYQSLHPKTVHWGDKNPHYSSDQNRGCLDSVARLFPGARFIHIIRDGRDVVTSLVRKTNPAGQQWTDFNGAHKIWISHVANATEFGLRNSNMYYELRYENLVSDDVGEAKRLFEFLELEMAHEVIDFCAHQSEVRTPLSGPTRSLEDSVASDWASVFDVEQQARSMELLGRSLAELGYQV